MNIAKDLLEIVKEITESGKGSSVQTLKSNGWIDTSSETGVSKGISFRHPKHYGHFITVGKEGITHVHYQGSKEKVNNVSHKETLSYLSSLE